MSPPNNLVQLFREIDKNKQKYIDSLNEAVAIQSVSAWTHKRSEVLKMVDWMHAKMQKLNIQTQLKDVGKQTLPDGTSIDLPHVLFGTFGDDPNKTTVLVYGHVDVQPALLEDGWDSHPFELTRRGDKLYGRGTSDDKGPVLCWLHAIEAYQELRLDIPVNVKMIFEAMEESGSLGLSELLLSEKDAFLADVDYVCVSDSLWLGRDKPCLTYGLRGICYFFIEVESAKSDLHSGVFGGSVHEAMTDLVHLLDNLVDNDGTIKIPGLYDDVAPLLPKEREIYPKIDFNIDEYRADAGCKRLLYEDKEQLLMHRWRYPTLSIHGIEGAFSEAGAKTVIPGKVVGKFSIRIVPNQTPEQVGKCVIDHINAKWQRYGSPSKMTVYMNASMDPWSEDPSHPHYLAGVKAVQHVYNVTPDFTRDGGSIPITLILQRATGKNILLLPIGAGDDNHHAQNEKIDVRNYIEGIKLLGAYLYEVGQLQ